MNDFLVCRVYYEDTDAGGVVYHARYLHFFERARTEFLRRLGFEQQQLLDQKNIAFVVTNINIDYKSPAKLDDQIVISTNVIAVKFSQVIFEQKINRGSELLSSAVVSVASVNLSAMKTVKMPSEVRAAFITNMNKD